MINLSIYAFPFSFFLFPLKSPPRDVSEIANAILMFTSTSGREDRRKKGLFRIVRGYFPSNKFESAASSIPVSSGLEGRTRRIEIYLFLFLFLPINFIERSCIVDIGDSAANNLRNRAHVDAPGGRRVFSV